MVRINFNYIILLSFISILLGQPDSRFRPFDWVLYKGPGSIQSITEGFTYAYIGTSSGGIKRFNLYSNYFDNPLTSAQGLKSNSIDAVHFDKITGLLWAASSENIQYSFSREGDWFAISLTSLGLSRSDKINRIGSSDNYVWLHARSSFVKLDHSSGMLIGIYPYPDELKINWSSGYYSGENNLRKVLNDFSFLDGWVYNGDELIDQLGRRTRVATGYLGDHSNVYFGSEDGTIFYGTNTMQSFSQINSDIINTDVSSLYLYDDNLYIGSQDYVNSKGISKLSLRSFSSEQFIFEEIINMNPSSIYSLHHSQNALWAGGDGIVLYHNLNDNYWRTLGNGRGIPEGKIFDLFGNESHLWIGSSKGLGRLEKSTLSKDPIGIEDIFRNCSVYDIEYIESNFWLGTSIGIYIYSINQSQLMQMLDIGRKNFAENVFNVTSLKYYDDSVYAVCDIGIIKFDFNKKEWDLIFTSGIYSNGQIFSMAINNKFIFLGLNDGFIKINKRTGFVKDYKFPFLGQINDIIIDGKEIWLGSSSGLIKFLWKRDL
ncbi:MAG: hypothetical protein ACJZ12_05100 [Candidatus Neomarinimicrobiota bacterium]